MKIVVVDDSVVFRMSISKALDEIKSFNVIKCLGDGQAAVKFLEDGNAVDLITLDLEMPVLDGISAIRKIRKFNKDVKIIVFSSLTIKGAEKTIEALECGANHFVTKEDIGGAATIEQSLVNIKEALVPAIEALCKPDVNNNTLISENKSTPKLDIFALTPIKPKLICLGSSTGGPEALGYIFANIVKKATVPILIVQHMPPIFTEKLAEMLNKKSSNVTVKEARDGDFLEDGVCYIAPGDFHMVVTKAGRIKLNQNEKECFVRPSVNVLFESIAANYTHQVFSIVLTGMGEDGATGVRKLKERGAQCIIQDKASSVVWGMPGAVSKVVEDIKEFELEEIPIILNSIFSRI